MGFREEIIQLLKQAGIQGAMSLLEVPPDPKLGDYALPCFTLAKEFKKAPSQIAQELSGRIDAEFFLDVKAVGPYVNFFIKPEERAKRILEEIEQGTFWKFSDERERILIEYPSPNTNKPLHLGHVRNMVLGSAVAKLLESDGKEVIQANLNNDRGIHICKSMLAYRKWGDGKEPDKKSDHFVGDFYVLFEKKAREDPSLEEEAQEMLQLWESGDQEVRTLWKKMNSWALRGFQKTYERYGITFDKEYNESEIYQDGKDIIEKHKGLFTTDEKGNLVAPLEKKGVPDKVVLRSDGTSIYMTQDIALTIRKIKDFSPDKQIWVVGNEQNLHFKQLYAILEMLGHKTERFYHLSYGMVYLPDGRMKSREGKVIDADDLLDEMERMAAEEIGKRRTEWDEERIQEKAKIVALGAIRFFILKYDPAKDFVFNPEESLSFEGDTGPYLQYTHARISSIIRKAGDIPDKIDHSLLTTPEEQELFRQLAGLPDAAKSAALNYKPSTLATKLIELGRAFNSFYHACPVTQADKGIRDARLRLLGSVQQVLAFGLALLSITAPEEM